MPHENSEQTRWFEEKVQPHELALRSWLRSRFPTLTDIDDLVQETYLRMLRAHRTHLVGHPKSYLFATARNAAMDLIRRGAVVSIEGIAEIEELSVLEGGPDSAEAANHDQELEILAAAIRALPDRCRQVVIMRKHHGLSYREIAATLGISENTVNAQITIGMMRCREYFRARGLALETRKETQNARSEP